MKTWFEFSVAGRDKVYGKGTAEQAETYAGLLSRASGASFRHVELMPGEAAGLGLGSRNVGVDLAAETGDDRDQGARP